MANARKPLLIRGAHSKTFLGETYRVALGIVNPNLAMVKVAGFFGDHASRVEFHVARFDILDAVHLKSDVMQSDFHDRLPQGSPFLEKGQIVKSVTNGNIALG